VCGQRCVHIFGWEPFAELGRLDLPVAALLTQILLAGDALCPPELRPLPSPNGPLAPVVILRVASRRTSEDGLQLPFSSLPSEHPGQDVGPVGHDAVDPEAEQPSHVGFVVDGPDVHPQLPLVRPPDQLRGHYAQPLVGFRAL
jgi:hypothetical protein